MKNDKAKISVVSPVYRAENMVHELVTRIRESVKGLTGDYEIVLVCDGSPDASWEAIVKECEADGHVKGVNLSRNFGQQYAITAGLAYAKGDWVVVMDCDLQDVPERIPDLYAKAQEGYDIVIARRIVKNVGWWKRFSSVAFHWAFDLLSGAKSDPAVSNFGIFSRKVIQVYNGIPSFTRSFRPEIESFGFKKAYFDTEQAPRAEGKSSYTLGKLFKSAYEVIISRTNKPLRMAVALGFTMSVVSFLLALYNFIAKLAGIITLSGYTTTVFSIWFVGGLILLVVGVLGLYIGKIFDQVKGFPSYIVRETLNVE